MVVSIYGANLRRGGGVLHLIRQVVQSCRMGGSDNRRGRVVSGYTT